MLIYIAGVPGVGKTTIIKKLVDELNLNKHKSEFVSGLPILCKLAGDISPQDFRKLPDEVREKYRPEMFKIIYNKDLKNKETIRILDGHFAYYKANGEEYSVRSIQDGDYKQMKAIFIINSNSEKILARRNSDSQNRTDRTLILEHIKEQLKIEETEAVKQAGELKIPIFFINNDSDIEKAVNEIYSKIKNILFPNEIMNCLKKEIKLK
jgi:adenylate kinase